MTAPLLFFYLFSAVVLFSACMVVFSRNPVHSVLFLILAFFNAAGLFLIAGAEFLALILVIVYVGAVAVLFLFVVMMLNINFASLRRGARQILPVGLAVGAVFVIELILVAMSYDKISITAAIPVADPLSAGENVKIDNTLALGKVLYTDYVLLFQAVGIILLVAMIGAIVLTLRHRKDVKRQSVSDQVGRRREKTVRLVSVKSGKAGS